MVGRTTSGAHVQGAVVRANYYSESETPTLLGRLALTNLYLSQNLVGTLGDMCTFWQIDW